MTDAPNEYDQHHPTQAEGEDPDAEEPTVVLSPGSRGSQAEGEDADHPDEHVVIDPVDPE